MKTITFTILFSCLFFSGIAQMERSGLAVNGIDSVIMGPGYADDIYYSFEGGVVAAVARANWDIGFHTAVLTASIVTNGGSGVNLYIYPYADTAGWSTVDTAGMAGWPVLYDDENDWENGAFNRNAAGQLDYGWGKYNMVTHDVVGDSIYILKALDGSFKKVWILRKNSINNTYYVRYANLDGSEDNTVELAINPYRNQNFIYFDLSAGSFVQREPDTASWDIVFTRYMAIQPNGTPYPVVGVQNNFKVYANEFKGVGPDFDDWTSEPFDSTKSAIGWEWKSFDMGTLTWTVADSLAYFVQSRTKDIYKLVFTGFTGTGSGKIIFNKAAVSPSAIPEAVTSNPSVSIYPNPVRDRLTVVFDDEVSGPVQVSVYDMTGKQVFSLETEAFNNSLNVRFPDTALGFGMHLMKIIHSTRVHSVKFMVNKL